MKKKKDEKILELQYTIEALENEIESLEEDARITHEKLWTVITENDRLTLRYEPYRPPGSEDEEYDFYELVNDNKSLTQKLLDKIEIIKELEEEVRAAKTRNNLLVSELIDVRKAVAEMKIAKEHKPRIKHDRYWNFSFELWPGSWGLNYYRYQWKKYGSRSREGSFQLGPIGFSWNREPKDRKH